MTENLTICVVHPTPAPNTETFIRAHIERLSGRVHEVVGWPPVYRQKPLGSTTMAANLSNKIRRRLGLGSIETKAFARFLKNHGVHVVLAEYGPTAVACMQSCLEAKVPLIPHFHGYDASMTDVLEQYREDYIQLFKQCPAIISVSEPMVEKLIQIGADRQKVHLNPYGVDTEKLLPIEAGNHPPVFLGVGRFVEKKAPFITILAFQQMVNQNSDARLVMVGDGPLLDTCAMLIRLHKLEAFVDLPGSVEQAEVFRLMGQARAFVQHSVHAPSGDMEGTPVAILEAGARGLPVIATRHAGITDVITHGETGLLVDEYDVKGMAACMLELAENRELANQIGRDAANYIRQQHRMSHSISRLYEILDSVV